MTVIHAPAPAVEPGPTGARRTYALSVDTGGTFTDGFVSDGQRTAQVKVDTTPHDLTVGFAACVEAAAATVSEDLPSFLSALHSLHFSSTIATNTIVERRGARVGVLVSAGAEERLYGDPERATALHAFVEPAFVRGIPEEVDANGGQVSAPESADVELAVRELLELGVRLLVVSFANAHLNPVNELRARAIIDASYPRHYLGAVPLMLASRISLAPEDHGRTAAAVLNAYLHPTLVRSLYRAEDQTRARGLKHPLLIVNTDGSSSRVAKTRAIDTYNSGPSAGVLGAGFVARSLGAACVCTFDVGGTTTDVAYIAGGEVPTDTVTELGPVSAPHPAVALHSFGLGGGSIIGVGEDGRIRIGPESAGSAPGPACFGLGGTDLTPTDVWVLLGHLEAGSFLGGRRTLDPDRARDAAERFAGALGRDPDESLLDANAAIELALGAQLRDWADRHPGLGETASGDRWLFSYGGGGGLLCAAAAEALGIDNIAVFPHSSVFSAFGGGLLPIAHAYEAVASDGADERVLADTFDAMGDAARRDLRAEGIRALDVVVATLSVAGVAGGPTTLAALLEGAAKPPAGATGPARCRLEVAMPRPARVEMLVGAAPAGGSRTIRTERGDVEVPLVTGLGSGEVAEAHGPAFIEAPDTTIFVPDGWTVRFTEQGYGVLSPRREEA